jgi:hypothetical protein
MTNYINLNDIPKQHKLTTKQECLVMELIAQQRCVEMMNITTTSQNESNSVENQCGWKTLKSHLTTL